MELKYEIESAIRVDYNDLESFLTERFNLPDEYEFACIEELSNDVVKAINVGKGEISKWDQEYINAVKNKKPMSFGTRAILCYLCDLGEIPEGEYLIDVSW